MGGLLHHSTRDSDCPQGGALLPGEAPRVLDGLGISIISTSKGVLSNKKAKKLGVGGELLCEVF